MAQESESHVRLLCRSTRLYTDFGAVFAVRQIESPYFTVLSYDPPKKRVTVKSGYLKKAGRTSIIRVKTDAGAYDLGDMQMVRKADHSVAMAAELKKGDQIHACEVKNEDGMIFLKIAGRYIPLHELIEADTEGTLKLNLPDVLPDTVDAFQTVVSVEPLPTDDAYFLDVKCPTPDDLSPQSGHNYMLWPDGTSFGSGIFVF